MNWLFYSNEDYLRLPCFILVSLLVAAGSSSALTTLDAAQVQRDFQNARGVFRLPAGSYSVSPPAGQAYHLYFRCQNQQPIEVDFTSVFLSFTDIYKGGIQWDGCTGVYFHGATITWSPLPFTQGTITSSPTSQSIIFQVASGYPTSWLTSLSNPFGWVVGSNGKMKPGTWDLNQYGIRIEQTGGNNFRMVFSQNNAPTINVQQNDMIIIRGPGGNHGMSVINTGSSTFSELTFLTAPCFGILEEHSPSANTYSSIVMNPGNPPTSGSVAPLISTIADGIHSIGAYAGPTISGCIIDRSGDDAIAIHGRWSLIVAVDQGARKLQVVDHDSTVANNFKPGDQVNVYDGNFYWIGTATVSTAVQQTYFKSSAYSSTMYKLNPLNAASRVYTELTFTNWPFTKTVQFDFFVSNPSRDGKGATVSNNVVTYNRGRGILYRGWSGSIAYNRVDGSSIGGIALFPEVADFIEGDFSRQVIIKENTINYVSYGQQQMGAILIASNFAREAGFGFVPGTGHDNIEITDNHIWSVPFINIIVTSAANIKVNRNDFHGAMCSGSPTNGMQFHITDWSKIIWSTETNGIQVCDNRYDRNNYPCSGTDYNNPFGYTNTVRVVGC